MSSGDDFEERLRETMRAFDSHAPHSVDLAVPVWRRSRRQHWLAIAAAVIVVAAISVVVAVRANSAHRSPVADRSGVPSSSAVAPGPLTCPDAYAFDGRPPKPPTPADDIASADRLAPAQPPSTAVVCAYLATRGAVNKPLQTLTGHRDLTADLAGISTSLALAPVMLPGRGDGCALYSSLTDGDNYLIGLTYPTGSIWVAAIGDHCAGASNGPFNTYWNLRQDAANAYDSGRWPAAGQPKDCDATAGRLGDDKQLVPGTPDRVVICVHREGDRGAPSVKTVDNPDALVNALNALPATPTQSSCHGSSKATVSTYLLFEYPTGPPVRTWLLPGCDPSVLSTGLQANDDGSVVKIVAQLLADK